MTDDQRAIVRAAQDAATDAHAAAADTKGGNMQGARVCLESARESLKDALEALEREEYNANPAGEYLGD